MDAEGNKIAQHQGARNLEGFKASGEKAIAFLDLIARAAEDDSVAAELLQARIDMGGINAADAQAELARLVDAGVFADKAELQASLEATIASQQIEQTIQAAGRDEAKQIAAGAEFWEAVQSGGVTISEDSRMYSAYWSFVMAYGDAQEDAEIYGHALGILDAKYGHIERNRALLDKSKARLEELKKMAEED